MLYILDENHMRVSWFMTFPTKLWLGRNHCVLGSIKEMGILEFMMGLDIKYYLTLKNTIPFTTGLDIL